LRRRQPDKLALVRKVILASASVPGLLPPCRSIVVIDGKPYTELHVDGGVSANLFLRPNMLGPKAAARRDRRCRTRRCGDRGGQAAAEAEVVKQSLLRIGGGTLEGVFSRPSRAI